MKREIKQVLLVILVFLASISYADELVAPKDVSQALELEYKEQLENAEKFKRAASKALKYPIESSPRIQTKRHATKYMCTYYRRHMARATRSGMYALCLVQPNRRLYFPAREYVSVGTAY